MKLHRQAKARAAGSLFIAASVAGVLSAGLLGIQSDPNSLVSASANQDQLVLGVVMVLTMGLAIILIPAVLYPVLKQHDEGLALGYLAARIVETVALLAATASPLLLVALSSEYTEAGAPDAAQFEILRSLIVSSDDLVAPISSTFFCVSALILNSLLYRSNLVPRAISVWGLAGAALYLVGGLLIMFDVLAVSSVPAIAMTAPIALNEMALAVWLIIKGFGRPPAAPPVRQPLQNATP